MSRRRAGGLEEEEEPILQWQDGVGNIPIWREEENVPTFNTSYRSVAISKLDDIKDHAGIKLSKY